ncbi:uncharacterized protein LOC131657889 [Vicia villosa]|uniref:uncharacterized protein LOC131657889 n=1 Tax=Vicia villosa TaxID=3911 RepID=UPI00273CA8FC|nr:uncharacterized protein LOC131657889 [Vicia villosa]
MYKVISKLLAGRLKKVLHFLISPCQSAFVPGRQLLDGVLVANEVVDFSKKVGRGSLLFKVDFEKAYDNVSWNYLRYMLRRMGFGEVWMRWMEMLIFNSSMSVLVNGSPTKEFVVEKDLRQGDPLSPFLFVLVTEGLAGLVRKSSEIGEFKGIYINGVCVVDILQFADDTLVMGECSWRQVWAIKAILRAFELVSGLGINYHKSKLIGINVVIRGKSSWSPLVTKIRNQLLGWQNRMPISVVKEVVRIQRNFLWGGGLEERRKIHWVSWKQVCLPFLKGGIGIKDVGDFNHVLLNKWRWRILKGEEALWFKVIKARYGDFSMESFCGGMSSNPLSSLSSSSHSLASVWWKDMIYLGNDKGEDPVAFNCRFVIGNGFVTPFWEARWVGNVCLKEEFPKLFAASLLKRVAVASMGGWIDGEWKWENFWVVINVDSDPGLVVEDVSLRSLLLGREPLMEGRDKVSWFSSADGIFP